MFDIYRGAIGPPAIPESDHSKGGSGGAKPPSLGSLLVGLSSEQLL